MNMKLVREEQQLLSLLHYQSDRLSIFDWNFYWFTTPLIQFSWSYIPLTQRDLTALNL